MKKILSVILLGLLAIPLGLQAQNIQGQEETLERVIRGLSDVSTYSVKRAAVEYFPGISGAPYPTFNTFVNFENNDSEFFTQVDQDERTFARVAKCQNEDCVDNIFFSAETITQEDVQSSQRYKALIYFHNNGEEGAPNTTAENVEIGLNLENLVVENQLVDGERVDLIRPFAFIHADNVEYLTSLDENDNPRSEFCIPNDDTCFELDVDTITDDIRLQLEDDLRLDDFDISIVPGTTVVTTNITEDGERNTPATQRPVPENGTSYTVVDGINGANVTINADSEFEEQRGWVNFDQIPGCFRYSGFVTIEFEVKPKPQVCERLEFGPVIPQDDGSYLTKMFVEPNSGQQLNTFIQSNILNLNYEIVDDNGDLVQSFANSDIFSYRPTEFNPIGNNTVFNIKLTPRDPSQLSGLVSEAIEPNSGAAFGGECIDQIFIEPEPELICENLEIVYDSDVLLDTVPERVLIGSPEFQQLQTSENGNILGMRYNVTPSEFGLEDSPVVFIWEARDAENNLLGVFAEDTGDLERINQLIDNPFTQTPPRNVIFWGVITDEAFFLTPENLPNETTISVRAALPSEETSALLNAQKFAFVPDFIKERNYYRSLKPFIINKNSILNNLLGINTANAQDRQELNNNNGVIVVDQNEVIRQIADTLQRNTIKDDFVFDQGQFNGINVRDLLQNANVGRLQQGALENSLLNCKDEFTLIQVEEDNICVDATIQPRSIPVDGGDQIFILDVEGDPEAFEGDFTWTVEDGELEEVECPDTVEELLNNGISDPAETLNEALERAFEDEVPDLEIDEEANEPDSVTTSFPNHCVRLSNSSETAVLRVTPVDETFADVCSDQVVRNAAPICRDLNLEPEVVVEGDDTLLTINELDIDPEFAGGNPIFEFRAKSGEILTAEGRNGTISSEEDQITGEQVFRTTDRIVRYIGAEPGNDQVTVAVLDEDGDPVSSCEDSLDVRADEVICVDLEIVSPSPSQIDCDGDIDIEIRATDSNGDDYQGIFTYEARNRGQLEELFEDSNERNNPLDSSETEVVYTCTEEGTTITVEADTGGAACRDQIEIEEPDNPEGELEKTVARYRNSSRGSLETSFEETIIVRDGDFVRYRIEYERHPDAEGIIDLQIEDSVADDDNIRYRNDMEIRHGSREIDECDNNDIENGDVCYIGDIGDEDGVEIFNTTRDITIFYDAEINSPVDDELCNDIDLDDSPRCGERYPNTVRGEERFPDEESEDEDEDDREYEQENDLNEDDAEVVAYCDYDEDNPPNVRFTPEFCEEVDEEPPGEIEKKVAKYRAGSRNNLSTGYEETVAVVNGDYVNFWIEYERNSRANGRIDVNITDNISDRGYLESRGGGRINYANNMQIEHRNRDIDECDDDDVENGTICYIGEIDEDNGVTIYNTTGDISLYFDGQIDTQISDSFCDELDRDLAHNCGESFTNTADAEERFPEDLDEDEDDRDYRQINRLRDDQADVIALCPYFFSDNGNILLEDGELPGTVDLSLCIDQPQTKIVIVPKIIEIQKTIIKTGQELVTDATHEVCREGYTDTEGEEIYGQNVSGLGGVCEFSLDVAAQWEVETIEKTVDQAVSQISQYNTNLNDTNQLVNPDLTDDGYTNKNDLSTNPNPNPRNHIYVKDNGDLVLGGDNINELVVGGESKTIIVKGHDVFIESNIVYGDLDTSLGIIVLGGNIVVSPNVTELNGVFFAQALDNEGGHLAATDEPDQFKQLRINGQVYADIESILTSRDYVGDPTKGGGNVVISYKLQSTPPGLAEVTGISFGEVAR